ncbi:type III secretion system inner rod subunit SctI [Chitinasiproducens palmae]|uniref:Uncharacterized protein n=1 Tax=Chitinasiproducens palmae TaxID=1770053 RepID=A0A1H2PKY7_9BURK|nr:type III secretion system inner rod subunit SctI [Chitinasiproducens palmae]SDV46262.1 hypothetical protein SAMN05216551_101211 [Chitinasiproducens palmae]
MSILHLMAGQAMPRWSTPIAPVASGGTASPLAPLRLDGLADREAGIAVAHLRPVGDMPNAVDVGLGAALRATYARLAGREASYHAQITAFADGSAGQDAAALLRLQATLGDASNEFALASTLARKFVGAIETLARAQ